MLGVNSLLAMVSAWLAHFASKQTVPLLRSWCLGILCATCQGSVTWRPSVWTHFVRSAHKTLQVAIQTSGCCAAWASTSRRWSSWPLWVTWPRTAKRADRWPAPGGSARRPAPGQGPTAGPPASWSTRTSTRHQWLVASLFTLGLIWQTILVFHSFPHGYILSSAIVWKCVTSMRVFACSRWAGTCSTTMRCERARGCRRRRRQPVATEDRRAACCAARRWASRAGPTRQWGRRPRRRRCCRGGGGRRRPTQCSAARVARVAPSGRPTGSTRPAASSSPPSFRSSTSATGPSTVPSGSRDTSRRRCLITWAKTVPFHFPILLNFTSNVTLSNW